MPRAPRSTSTGEEVLFLTSQERLHNAYIAWYNLGLPGDPQNFQNAAEQVRCLMRYLKVPTADETQRYRRDQLPHD